MKIAFHVDQLWFPAPGGIGTYVRRLPAALQKEDPAIGIVAFRSRWTRAPSDPSSLPDAIELDGSIRSLYPSWALLGRPALPASLATANIVHATNPAAVPPAAPGQALVVTVHDLAFERIPQAFTPSWRWLYRTGLRAAIKRADALLVPSRSTAEDLLAHGADPSRVHVTPLASSLFTSASEDRDPGQVLARMRVPLPYVLFVGTLEPRKNLVRLVRSYRRTVVAAGLPHALVLAGPSGWGSDELLHELAAPGGGRIIRTGAVSSDDLDALYRAADCFAYPSLYEGFGLPVVEAMSRGVPTLTSNVSSLPETAGDAALLVDPADEDAIAAALERILTDRDLSSDLRERGPRQAAGFTWAATARATLQAYGLVTGAA